MTSKDKLDQEKKLFMRKRHYFYLRMLHYMELIHMLNKDIIHLNEVVL